MKKVLFLSYYFPPRNRIASFRSAAIAKYLPRYGWKPTILCEDWMNGSPDYDPEMLQGLEDTEVHRLPTSRPRGLFRFYVRNLAPFLTPEKTPYHWSRLATKAANILCQNCSFDAILATYDPLATLTLAARLSNTYKIPWIADLRDSWQVQKIGPLHKRLQIARHEKRLCLKADQIVTVSNRMAQELKNKLNRDVFVITNGFDPELFPETQQVSKDTFTILYAGSFNISRSPIPLFKAIESSINNGRISANCIHIRFLGATRQSIACFNLEQFPMVSYSIEPRIPHKIALKEQMQSSALLVLTHPDEPGVLTGKVFDYLGARRPILAIPDDRDSISRLLTVTGAGISVSTPSKIENLLVEWYQKWLLDKAFNLPRNENVIGCFTRQEQTRKLAKLLDLL
jgi:glycosyltransferase involved in cell wall biosynthesis